jgi:hypothetical protein
VNPIVRRPEDLGGVLKTGKTFFAKDAMESRLDMGG